MRTLRRLSDCLPTSPQKRGRLSTTRSEELTQDAEQNYYYENGNEKFDFNLLLGAMPYRGSRSWLCITDGIGHLSEHNRAYGDSSICYRKL